MVKTNLSTKEQIIRELDNLSEKNLVRLNAFLTGLTKNGDNKEVKKL